MSKIEYTILYACDIDALHNLVGQYMQDNWLPQGGVTAGSTTEALRHGIDDSTYILTTLYQAMVREVD